MSYVTDFTLPVRLTIYPKKPARINEVMTWCDEHIGQSGTEWEMVNSPCTVTNVLWFAFKEEKSATMFALRWS